MILPGPRIQPLMGTPATADPLVSQLLALLAGGNAHVKLAAAIEGFPEDLRGTVPERLPYSAWQILEHLRITQKDILEFSAPPSEGYRTFSWPKDYWPATAAPPSAERWDQTVAAIQADHEGFAALLTAPDADLHRPFPWGDGQTLLREALLLADHNSYHLGEIVVVRRLLDIWKR